MDDYRKMDIDLATSPGSGKKVIHDLTEIGLKVWYQCPFCEHEFRKGTGIDASPTSPPADLCTPNKRKSWGWWPSRYCTIPGYHKHSHCSVCDTEWIMRMKTPDNVVGYVP